MVSLRGSTSKVFKHDLRHLAEILDFGYPQNSETDTLKMYITTESVKSEQAVVRRVHVICWTDAEKSAAARGIVENHHSSDWRNLMAAIRCKVPQE